MVSASPLHNFVRNVKEAMGANVLGDRGQLLIRLLWYHACLMMSSSFVTPFFLGQKYLVLGAMKGTGS
jgi:hypothetical protein